MPREADEIKLIQLTGMKEFPNSCNSVTSASSWKVFRLDETQNARPYLVSNLSHLFQRFILRVG